jgi:hypothetical protein
MNFIQYWMNFLLLSQRKYLSDCLTARDYVFVCVNWMYDMASLNLIWFNLIQFRNFNSLLFTYFLIRGSDTNIFILKIYKSLAYFCPTWTAQMFNYCWMKSYVTLSMQLATLSLNLLSLPLHMCSCSRKWNLWSCLWAYGSLKGIEIQNFYKPFSHNAAVSLNNYQYCVMFSINFLCCTIFNVSSLKIHWLGKLHHIN